MSVVKSKRNKSGVEFEMILFQLVDGIDNLVEHDFYAEGMLAVKNKMFLDMRSRALEELTDKLVFYIKIANSIYPQCITEWEERRVAQGKAIGTCYAIPWRGSVIHEHNACRNIVARMDALYRSLFPVHQEKMKPSRKRMVKAINHEIETEDIQYCLTY